MVAQRMSKNAGLFEAAMQQLLTGAHVFEPTKSSMTLSAGDQEFTHWPECHDMLQLRA